MNRTRTGLVLFALLAVLDVAGITGLFVDNGPPWFIAIGSGVLGLVTLGALLPAWRGGRGAMLAVVASRAVSAIIGISIFFAPEAPAWAKTATGGFIALTVVGAVMVADALRAMDTAPRLTADGSR